MRRVSTKTVIKSVKKEVVTKEVTPCNTPVTRRISSGISTSDIEEAQQRMKQERELFEGSVLVAKRKRSNTLKSLPSLGDSVTDTCNEIILQQSFHEHKDFVSKVKFYPTSRTRFFSSGNDGKIVYYDLEENNCFTFSVHEGGISDFDLSKGGRYLITASWDSTVKLWDLRTVHQDKLPLLDEYTLPGRPNAILFNPMRAGQFLVGDSNGKLLLFTGNSKQPVDISFSNSIFSILHWAVSEKSGAILSLAFSINGRYLIAGTASGDIIVYEQLKNPPIFELRTQTCLRTSVTGLSYNTSKNLLLATTCDHKARLLTFPSLQLKKIFFHQQETYNCKVTLSHNAKISFVTSEDYNIHLFDNSNGNLLCKWKPHDTVVSSIDVAASDLILTSSYNGSVSLWTRMSDIDTEDLQ